MEKTESTNKSTSLGDAVKISGQIGQNRNLDFPDDCDGAASCSLQIDDVSLSIDSIDSGFNISWQTSNTEATLQDCLDLNGSDTNWFGGPEKWEADWPVENVRYRNRIYTTLKGDNGAVAERYWLNSNGGYVFVGDKVPLYVDQNTAVPGSICFIGAATDSYAGRDEVRELPSYQSFNCCCRLLWSTI